MNKDIKISCIIPMYNAENFIKNTIEAILKQDYENYEIIIVDDGSNDKSLEIIESNFQHLDNLIVYSQPNRGVSSARNQGIKLANYPYIYFMDCDDIIHPEAFKIMSKKINDNDLLVFAYEVKNNYSIKYSHYVGNIDGVFEISDFSEKFFKFQDTMLLNVNWNKLYKREIILDNNLSFDTDMKMGEDALFNLSYYECCKKIKFINDVLYEYIINENQSIHKIYPNYYEMQKKLFKGIYKFLKSKDKLSINEKDFYEHYIEEVLNSISFITRENISFKKKLSKVRYIYKDSYFKNAMKLIDKNTLKRKILAAKSPILIVIIYMFIHINRKI